MPPKNHEPTTYFTTLRSPAMEEAPRSFTFADRHWDDAEEDRHEENVR